MTFRNEYKEITEAGLRQGAFLWITHADRVPPHIGISLDGNYFSLQVHGKDDTEVETIFRAVRLKKIPALFLRLDEGGFSSERFLAVKNEYSAISEAVNTCLVPILDLYGIRTSGFLLPAFLKYLEEKGQILAYFTLNLPPDFTGIKSYSLEDVTRHLDKIKHAERPEHISSRGRAR
ncbi:MAG: hypothetical protein K0R65_2387 [Crocinitomicaceae bacterium]|jgi:hypothetical protein|nr:hypothetical protein [Crocinitomicaceae bacterium]